MRPTHRRTAGTSGRARTTGVAGAAGVTLTTVGLLAGCAAAVPVPGVEYRGVVLDVEQGALTAGDVAAAQTAFGLDLLHAVCATKPGENLLLSPTSAAEALGLLQPAAAGDTTADVAALLHLPDWSPDLAAALQAHTAALDALDAAGDDADTLHLSNRVWADSSVEPTQDYLDAVATGYDAGLETLDFAADPAGATDRINAAVAQDTDGLVPTLYDEPLDRDTAVVLTDAVHLDADWATPFEEARPAPFEAVGGRVDVDMMTGGAGWVTEADGWARVELPYRDGTLAAVAVLPPEGVDPCTTDAARLGSFEDALPSPADVSMPRLRLEQTHDLLDVLVGLGLPRAGDWSGFGASSGLGISGVVQKTFMEVDEEGTEAAAATGVTVVTTSAPAPPERVVLDRPFLLVLTDTATRSPLFVAAVQDPTA